MTFIQFVHDFISKNKLPAHFASTIDQHFVPLANRIKAQSSLVNRPIVIGINGCQGSGKSTMTDFLASYLSLFLNCPTVGMSIDDFYLTSGERLELSLNVHPLLKTRGVPGTHDIQLATNTIKALKQGTLPVAIPGFNKAIDDRYPENCWHKITKSVDVILFEGWCVASPAQTEDQLVEPVNKLETIEDPDSVWRSYVNVQLNASYARLFETLDRTVMLCAPGFLPVKKWRLEQETKLLAKVTKDQGDVSAVMTEAEIEQFIPFYQRITEHTLKELPPIVDDLFILDDQREIINSRF